VIPPKALFFQPFIPKFFYVWKVKFVKIFWALFLVGIACVTLFFYMLNAEYFGSLPNFEELENPESSLATEIISTDGVIIGKYYTQNIMKRNHR